ncbi:hypothetical protein ETAA8_08250 [Anatilimnocola aggregata]|uniref:Uncharacterized protein n=1 Tax=Anatilimnocola aggregata TaxID=2528021 RepID=A0A517Y692_9BACT|nr:hypothetical protein [Anatilimnocola aggregata]QDU25754.1 hypothetical protein ETAA8_08250 [Anatilimnocola aggregata]
MQIRRSAPTLSFRTVVWIAMIASGLATGLQRVSADPPPKFQAIVTPATAESGPIVKLSGRFGSRYTAYDVAENTIFNLRDMQWDPRSEHPLPTAFSAGEQPKPPTNLTILGGVVDGRIPLDWSWSVTHAFSGSAFYTVATGQQIIDGARIHNVQDGWRPRETPEFRPRAYLNTGSFVMRNCYVTGIRDDCIENDEFLPGKIEDCLFDGVFTFYSEQNETINGVRTLEVPTIGPAESPDVFVTRSLIRLDVTSGGEPGPGTLFKLHGYKSPNHRIVLTDCTFAASQEPRAGWKQLNFPKTTEFRGTNHLLWLGETGKFGGKVPDGITLVEGDAARAKWHDLRNRWLTTHGYETRAADDLNTMQTPVAAPTRMAD